ncbi:hypothetical protein D3C84_932020 [compost metagenome]
MQQAILDDVQLVAGQYFRQVIDLFQAQGRTVGLQTVEQLRRNALQALDQLVGVGRLLPE